MNRLKPIVVFLRGCFVREVAIRPLHNRPVEQHLFLSLLINERSFKFLFVIRTKKSLILMLFHQPLRQFLILPELQPEVILKLKRC